MSVVGRVFESVEPLQRTVALYRHVGITNYYTHARFRRVGDFEIIATRELCMSMQCVQTFKTDTGRVFIFFVFFFRLIITTVAWKRDRVRQIADGRQRHPKNRGKRHRRRRARFNKLDFYRIRRRRSCAVAEPQWKSVLENKSTKHFVMCSIDSNIKRKQES